MDAITLQNAFLRVKVHGGNITHLQAHIDDMWVDLAVPGDAVRWCAPWVGPVYQGDELAKASFWDEELILGSNLEQATDGQFRHAYGSMEQEVYADCDSVNFRFENRKGEYGPYFSSYYASLTIGIHGTNLYLDGYVENIGVSLMPVVIGTKIRTNNPFGKKKYPRITTDSKCAFSVDTTRMIAINGPRDYSDNEIFTLDKQVFFSLCGASICALTYSEGKHSLTVSIANDRSPETSGDIVQQQYVTGAIGSGGAFELGLGTGAPNALELFASKNQHSGVHILDSGEALHTSTVISYSTFTLD